MEMLLEVGLMVVAMQLSGPVDVALGRDFMALVPLNSSSWGFSFA